MTTTRADHFDVQTFLARIRREKHGFLSAEDVNLMAQHESSRLTPVLVRCGGCRFTCAAQDVRHLIALVESGTDDGHRDYVRDVALLAEGR